MRAGVTFVAFDMTGCAGSFDALSYIRGMTRYPAIALSLLSSGLLLGCSAAEAQHAVPLPLPAHDVSATATPQTAVFAGGCFWTQQAVFENVKGVLSTTAGYDGGTAGTATYDQVSSETTRHAESLRITFDPRRVTYGQLLRVFFSIAHDPTELNRQGPDTGASYRSAIFPQSPVQAAVARAYIAQLDATHAFAKPIVTHLETGTFYPAEAYHQHFYDRNPDYPYVVMWDKPKVAVFKAAFPALAR